jgi:hypothetical protein
MANKINNLTFRELRNELANCGDNKIKATIIRNIMYERYVQHMNYKQQYINKLEQKRSKKHNKQIHDQNNKQSNDVELLTPDDFDIISKESNNINEPNKKQEYGREAVNNNIISRLDGDIDIRNARNKKVELDFVPPYANTAGDNYASFEALKKQQPKQ